MTISVVQATRTKRRASDGLRRRSSGRLDLLGFQELVVEFARRGGYGAILRGLRTVGDFEFEYQMALTNRHLQDQVETVFVMPSHAYSYVSSSLIKDVVRHGGDVSSFVTPRVEAALRGKLVSPV